MGNIFVIIAFVAYALVILGIGIFSYKKSKSMNDYFIGGRQLGSWTSYFSPGFGYERLAADGSARRDLRQRAD